MSENFGLGIIPPLRPAPEGFIAREDVEELRANLHHLINPIIGMLRRREADPELDFEDRTQYFVDRLYRATDLADAVLGERPNRELLAELQAELEAKWEAKTLAKQEACEHPLHQQAGGEIGGRITVRKCLACYKVWP